MFNNIKLISTKNQIETALDPKFAESWNNKGKALKALGRITEAEAAFAKANKLGHEGWSQLREVSLAGNQETLHQSTSTPERAQPGILMWVLISFVMPERKVKS